MHVRSRACACSTRARIGIDGHRRTRERLEQVSLRVGQHVVLELQRRARVDVRAALRHPRRAGRRAAAARDGAYDVEQHAAGRVAHAVPQHIARVVVGLHDAPCAVAVGVDHLKVHRERKVTGRRGLAEGAKDARHLRLGRAVGVCSEGSDAVNDNALTVTLGCGQAQLWKGVAHAFAQLRRIGRG
jgi:hypothetical protein